MESEGRESSRSYLPLSISPPFENGQYTHTKENHPQIHQPRDEGWSPKASRSMWHLISPKYFLKQLIKLILHSVLETKETDILPVSTNLTIKFVHMIKQIFVEFLMLVKNRDILPLCLRITKEAQQVNEINSEL